MRKPELPALTGIRFYAAFLVFLSHVPCDPGMDQLAGHHLLFNAGVVGVSFFFLLSGFILTYNYVDVFSVHLARREYWKFLWDRLTKIYPVHCAITVAMIPLQFQSPNLPLDWRAAPVHLLLAQCFWPSPQPPFYSYLNVPSWSISCEWFFYLCAPLVLYALAGRYLRVALFSLLAVYACAFGWFVAGSSDVSKLFYVSWFAPSRLPEFVTGVMLARLLSVGSISDEQSLGVHIAVGRTCADPGGCALSRAGPVAVVGRVVVRARFGHPNLRTRAKSWRAGRPI